MPPPYMKIDIDLMYSYTGIPSLVKKLYEENGFDEKNQKNILELVLSKNPNLNRKTIYSSIKCMSSLDFYDGSIFRKTTFKDFPIILESLNTKPSDYLIKCFEHFANKRGVEWNYNPNDK